MRKFFKSRLMRAVASVLVVAILIPAVLELGTLLIGALWRPWTPDYERCNIEPLLDGRELSDADYELLFEQTGLTRLGIDGLIGAAREEDILEIQDKLFEGEKYYYEVFAPFTGIYRTTVRNHSFAVLENGDILYAPCSYFSFFKLGHISLVTDSQFKIAAEAQGYERDYEPVYANDFLASPAYVILRPKADAELREAAAEYVDEELREVEYRITVGLFSEKFPEELSFTHCSHMIWYTYMRLGLDLDASGGGIVTPGDILHSENVEIVQIYGMNPKDFVSK